MNTNFEALDKSKFSKLSNLFRLFNCGLWPVGHIGLVTITIQTPCLELAED